MLHLDSIDDTVMKQGQRGLEERCVGQALMYGYSRAAVHMSERAAVKFHNGGRAQQGVCYVVGDPINFPPSEPRNPLRAFARQGGRSLSKPSSQIWFGTSLKHSAINQLLGVVKG